MRTSLAFALALVGACGGAEPPPTPTDQPADAPAHGGEELGEQGHGGAVDDHHAHGGGHMQGMEAHRSRLRSTLGTAYDEPVAGLDLADPAAGRTLYEARCLACHGAEGKGDGPAGAALNPPPADFTDPHHASFYSDAGRVETIRGGVPETAMPAFRDVLTEREILDIYAYVKALRASP
jgi:mono/diheme cytochrome c family protein